jgi:maltose-binding protein MalE
MLIHQHRSAPASRHGRAIAARFMVFLAASTLITALPAPAKAAPTRALTTLTLWDEEQPDIQTALDARIAAFRKSQTRIRVRRSHFKTEDLRVQFQTGAMAQKGADIVLAPNDFAGVFAIMGLIQAVQTWADMPRFAPKTAAAITDAKGKSWGLPINQGNHLLLFVNKALIKTPPETVEQLVAAAKPLTKPAKRRYGLAYNSAEPFWFVPFLGAYGGRPLEGVRPTLNNAAMKKALALVKSFKFDAGIMPGDCDYACAEGLFLDRRAAMTINGDWAIHKYSDALGKDLAILPLPTLAATGLPLEPMLSGKYLLFNAALTGERLAAAKTFAEYMVTPETQTILAQETKRLPSLAALTDASFVRNDPLLAASKTGLVHSQPMPMAVQMRAVWDAIRPQLQMVLAGNQSPEAAAGIMQKDADTKIKEMGR